MEEKWKKALFLHMDRLAGDMVFTKKRKLKIPDFKKCIILEFPSWLSGNEPN